MEKMQAYREKLEAQLQEWKVKIELLEGKAAKAVDTLCRGGPVVSRLA